MLHVTLPKRTVPNMTVKVTSEFWSYFFRVCTCTKLFNQLWLIDLDSSLKILYNCLLTSKKENSLRAQKGEKIIKNNCNDLTIFFACFLHIISYKNVWDLSKKIVKTSRTFFVIIAVLTQIVRIIWCNLWCNLLCHIKHCAIILFLDYLSTYF